MAGSNPFWNSTDLEPKRQHRWALELPAGAGMSSLKFFLTKTDNPSLEINETEHKFFGHSFFFPGHLTWQPITMTLVDNFGTSGTASSFAGYLQKAGYNLPDKAALPQTISKDNASQGVMFLRQYKTTDKGEAKSGETWKIFNGWFQKINFGALDYSSDGMVTVDVTLRYDYATHANS